MTAVTADRSVRVVLPAADISWQDRALCAQIGGDLFYPDLGEPAAEALRVCGMCSVRGQCLQYAIDHDEQWGIWGGTTERARARILGRTARQDLCGNELHLMDDGNVLTQKDGTRHCRACRRANERKVRQSKRDAIAVTTPATQPRKAVAA